MSLTVCMHPCSELESVHWKKSA